MNTVKYKAWTDEGMINVRRITFAVDICYVVSDNDEHDGYEFQIETKNLRQFTGLTDKAGVEIYEGDILAVAHQKYLSTGDERFYKNGYNNRAVKWRVTPHHNGWNVYDAPQTQFEVIGNIYENQELLEANQ